MKTRAEYNKEASKQISECKESEEGFYNRNLGGEE